MARREFSSNVKLEIIKRTLDQNGNPRCEKCGGVAKQGEIHHIKQDAMEIDKSEKLTAKDGQLLCKPCHQEITSAQAPILAKAKRREKKALGVKILPVKRIQSAPFPKSERTVTRQPKMKLPPKPLYRSV